MLTADDTYNEMSNFSLKILELFMVITWFIIFLRKNEYTDKIWVFAYSLF